MYSDISLINNISLYIVNNLNNIGEWVASGSRAM